MDDRQAPPADEAREVRAPEVHVQSENESETGSDSPFDASDSHVDAILAETESRQAEQQSLSLSSGRRISTHTEMGHDVIRIENPDGVVALQVTMTPEGPLLSFRAADIKLEATRNVEVACDKYVVRAEGGIEQHTRGDLREWVDGDRISFVRGTQGAVASRTHIESKKGDVRVLANDDVKLLGERVKLNCS